MKPVLLSLALALISVAGSGAADEPVHLEFERDMTLRESDVPYRLDVSLTEIAPTRIGIDALLDLTDVQAALPDLLSGASFSEACNAEIGLQDVKASASGQTISAEGRFELQTYRCSRKLREPPKREDLVTSKAVTFSAAVSVLVKDQCVFFELNAVDVLLADQPALDDDQEQILQDARAIFLKASEAVLKRTPICPEMPPELASIDPKYEAGGTTEIGTGGIGVGLKGSVDISTETIIDVLQVLQDKGFLPGKP
ncbi:MAG: hypothetical protein ACR2O2_07680 [Ruegeria sp.]